MGITYSQSKIHWNYYLAIEKDFEKISRYVEFCEENSKTFSIEFARIIMSSSSEIDVLMKKICEILGNAGANNIHDYRNIINQNIPDFNDKSIFLPYYGMQSKPWKNWQKKDGVPLWWTANNKIKHHRGDNFEKANLKNAFNAIGALLLTETYYYKLELERKTGNTIRWFEVTNHHLQPSSSLLRLSDEFYGEW